MKKLIKTVFFLILIGFVGYFIYVNYINIIPKKDIEKEHCNITNYFAYGNHLNIKGILDVKDKTYKSVDLVLYNGKDKSIKVSSDVIDNKINFYTSQYINEGIYLDDIKKGIYYLFLRLTYEDDDNKIYKYYALNNKTKYDDITYYTLSKYNNKILINFDNEYNTMSFNIKSNSDNNIYDITIDPGHGGMDVGAIKDKYKEAEIAMNIAEKVKSNLEKENLKVKLTHDRNDLTKDEVMEEYNKGGRAVIPNEVKSKYTFSIHINKNDSSKVRGIEVYTPSNINYDFATSIADKIVSSTDFDYSSNKLNKVNDGVYTHTFSQSEINESMKKFDSKNYKRYNITDNSNYLYMIRETGGYMTGAYVNNSNPDKVGYNPYYNSNIGNESYLLELGYLSNSNDLKILIKSEDKLAKAISESIIKELGF